MHAIGALDFMHSTARHTMLLGTKCKLSGSIKASSTRVCQQWHACQHAPNYVFVVQLLQQRYFTDCCGRHALLLLLQPAQHTMHQVAAVRGLQSRSTGYNHCCCSTACMDLSTRTRQQMHSVHLICLRARTRCVCLSLALNTTPYLQDERGEHTRCSALPAIPQRHELLTGQPQDSGLIDSVPKPNRTPKANRTHVPSPMRLKVMYCETTVTDRHEVGGRRRVETVLKENPAPYRRNPEMHISSCQSPCPCRPS